jgi:thiamine pyrophosphate-dependent acetolactate synthase large subunit-like protein
MVAMSMADGYARLTGKPQCVIVHVDVGTQGLGAAVHNSSTGRAPVLLFAGLSPFTIEGEMRGSRTEYIHWIQDVPDQKQIVAQYCRYSGEIKTGKNVKQMVNRALQFARSDPQGPVYLCGAREVMEEDIDPYAIPQNEWDPVELGGLPRPAVTKIAEALAGAKEPLIITGFGGRDHRFPGALVELADTVKGLRVLDTGGSDMCFPADHPGWLGLRFGADEAIKTADVILVVNCDVPWVNKLCHPRKDARIFHVDVDPLKQQMPVFYIKAESRYRADALSTVEQITAELRSDSLEPAVSSSEAEQRGLARQESYERRLDDIKDRTKPRDGEYGTGYLCRELRRLCPQDTIWAIEAVTNTAFVHDNIQPTLPGSWINCGGGGLGWSGGGALGIKLATEVESGGKGKFVVQIVGDGTFLFSVPGSVYWISKRYNIPVLTIILNNKGESKVALRAAAANKQQVGTRRGGLSFSSTRMARRPRRPTRRSISPSTHRRTMRASRRLQRAATCSRRGSIVWKSSRACWPRRSRRSKVASRRSWTARCSPGADAGQKFVEDVKSWLRR